MSPTVRKAMGNAALALALVGTGVVAVAVWKRYGQANPYAGLDKRHVADPNAVIQAKDVEIRHYEKGKRVASAHADRLTIGQDRGLINLKGIRNGVSQTPEGPMQFAAGAGVLRPTMKMIDVSGGVRVKGKNGVDFDIQSDQARIDGRLGEITVPTPLKGKILGGQLTADRMVRRMNADYISVTNPSWTGRPPRTKGSPIQTGSKVWNIREDLYTKNGPNITHTYGRATDGEIFIAAPTMLQDTKTEVITALKKGTERVIYRSAKADIVADKVLVYQKEKRALCTGHVLVYVRAKKDWDKPLPSIELEYDKVAPLVPDIPPDLVAKAGSGAATDAEKARIDELRSGKNLRDYPTQMAAEEITYWYGEGERHAIAKGGNPTAFQKFDDGRWRQTWAPEAHYDGEKNLLDLVGGKEKREVHVKDSLADVVDCFTARMSTREDQTEEDEMLEMSKPIGRVIDFNDDKPKTGGTKPTAPPKPGGDPPPKKPNANGG